LPVPDHVKVRYNPHPPGAILLTVPLAGFNFDRALDATRLLQLAALAAAWTLAYRMFAPPVPSGIWGLFGGMFGIWAPVWQGLDWGQPIGLLALAGTGIWAFSRRPRPLAFGLLLGLACTIRPFFGIAAVVAIAWPVRFQILAAAGALVGGLVPFAILNIAPWQWYRLASDAGAYVAECGSLPGVLHLSTGGGIALYALAAVGLALWRRRGLDADSTCALAAVAAMLTYPLAWFQYDVSLIPVAAWLGVEAHRSGKRLPLACLAAFLAARALPDIIPTGAATAADAIARIKSWLQVAARGTLLVGAIAAACTRRKA
jgi:hypothetical protein